VDCIDLCADPAVVAAVRRGLAQAQALAGASWQAPWLMISLNDGADPHFRKAFFPFQDCPASCPRPCIQICPAAAIGREGVDAALCYGCGRCGPVCPLGIIDFQAIDHPPETLGPLLLPTGIDALEIHTQVGNRAGFERLWQGLAPLLPQLKLLSISFPDGPGLREYLTGLAEFLQASQLSIAAKSHLIWQTDGIPMSGDLGANRAKASIRLAQKVLSWSLPGHVQLAGGTNQHSLALAQAQGLAIAGIAYGSYARQRVQELPFAQALAAAQALVHPLKQECATYG